MTSLAELEERVSKLEHQVAEVLRGASAVRETQVEDQAETRGFQAEIREEIAKLNAGMARIADMLQTLIDRRKT